MNLGNVLLIYICMCVVIVSIYPETIINEGDNNILNIFKLQYNETDKSIRMYKAGFSDELDRYTNNNENEEGLFQKITSAVSDFFQSFVDGLKNIIGILKILSKFLFTPFLFITNPNLLGSAPFYIQLIIAIPLIFVGLFGLIELIRH